MLSVDQINTIIPRVLNTQRRKESVLPIGVTYIPRISKYMAKCRCIDLYTGIQSQKTIGYYDSPDLAFKAYCSFKENFVLSLAVMYESVLDIETYERLINYRVERETE